MPCGSTGPRFSPAAGDRRPTGGPSRDRSCSHCARRARISYTLLKNLSQPGEAVTGELDWQLRFRRMQGHSGEHIMSGTVHRLFGCDNVGFHMGEDGMTIDFSTELSREDLSRAELEANRAVWRNVPCARCCGRGNACATWSTAARRS